MSRSAWEKSKTKYIYLLKNSFILAIVKKNHNYPINYWSIISPVINPPLLYYSMGKNMGPVLYYPLVRKPLALKIPNL